MKLTCVTAAFNAIAAGRREQLIRCVNSVAQLKTEHEHLVYDGASTDGTMELLRELEKTTPGLKVVSEPDAGIYDALNKGVRDAAGEWFYVLGCDDCIVRPSVLDRILNEPRQAGVVATDVFLGDAGCGEIRAVDPTSILRCTPYCHQGVLMRTDVVRKFGGFDVRYRIAADYKLFLAIHMNGGVPVELLSGDEKNNFACFGISGESETNGKRMFLEFDRILAEMFGLNPERMVLYRRRRHFPVAVFSRFLCSRDICLRRSARWMALMWLRRLLRLLFYPVVVVTRSYRLKGK